MHPTVSDFLTEQFYRWEVRGRGWMVADRPIQLEPPFRQFEGHSLPRELFEDDAVEETWLSRLFRPQPARDEQRALPSAEYEIEEPLPTYLDEPRELVELQVALPRNNEPSREIFEQCLFALTYCKSALAFEVVGDKEGLVTQLVATIEDAEQVYSQVKAHFPEAVLSATQNYLQERWCKREQRPFQILDFGLGDEFMWPLRSAKELATDPLVAVCGALEHLRDGEVAAFQVLFEPARQNWTDSIWRAVTTGAGDESFFDNAPDLVKQTEKKLTRPLFAVVLRVGAQSPTESRTWEIAKGLSGALKLFNNPAGNELIPLENEIYPDREHASDLIARCSRRSGMLLNSDELVSLVHLPTAAVRSRKLKREIKRTKEAPAIATGSGVVLGENEHEGKITRVAQNPQQRVRHTHVIGASGTGKSTLLLNMICQDIYQGQGLALLDPHGDLVDQVLNYVPPERYRDVILFDPSDESYPIGFNVLSAHSNLEKNLLASDLVGVFRRLSTSWGDQMNSVLGNAILAFLESKKGGTLLDLRRFLIEAPFRKEFLATVEDPEVVYYWQHGFPILKSNSVGPLLTRLDTFLRPKAIRYMVAQRENKLDFAGIMNDSRIFLAKLPQGLIGEENAYLLGALLVAKFHQLAISRQEMQAADRRPFYFYLDEFQHFATPSMATILSGVRKYQLGLVLAHHELRQLQHSGELASAVLSHPFTRICFRLGDEDARKLAEGFSYFEARDLQNLGTGEAIGRIERADNDFNLRTILPPEVEEDDAQRRRAYLQYISRVVYGTPREKVEEELAKSRFEPKPERVDPFAKRTAEVKEPAAPRKQEAEPAPEPIVRGAVPSVSTPPVAPAAPKIKAQSSPGRGGPEHKRWQHLLRLHAEGLGWLTEIEKKIPNGWVDLCLEKNGITIAVEVSVTRDIGDEVEKLKTCVDIGFSHVLVVCDNAEKLQKLQKAALAVLPTPHIDSINWCVPDDVPRWLLKIGGASEPRSAGGRTVKINQPTNLESDVEARKQVSRLAAKAIQKMKTASKRKKA